MPRAEAKARFFARLEQVTRRIDSSRQASGEPSAVQAPGGRRSFSDAAIAAALTVRAAHRLAPWQVGGRIASVFAPLGLALPVPEHTPQARCGRMFVTSQVRQGASFRP
jgi:hypothetical protein